MAEGQTHIENGPRLFSNRTDAVLLLALEIRAKKAGFALFQRSALLDWGMTCSGKATPAIRRIGSLLDLHSPTMIVIRRPRLKHSQAGASNVEKIKRGAKRRSIPVQSLDAYRIHAFFKQRGCSNKHQIGLFLAERFPELASRVPPKRKLWQSEPHNALLFDAVATAVTFLTEESRPGNV